MKHAVIQSFRTENVPPWITTCLDSVRHWAGQQGHDYVFVDDAFFAYAPRWVHERCGKQVFPVTDVARLYLLREYLDRGYDRVTWLDADVLVFDPENFVIAPPDGYAFSLEVMVGLAPDGRIRVSPPGVNNAGMCFDRGNPVLDFYRFAAEQVLRHLPPGDVPRTAIGPQFLTGLSRAMPLARMTSIGLFTQELMADIADGGRRLCPVFAQHFGHRVAAANLCHFQRHDGDDALRRKLDASFATAVGALLETRGDVVNRHLPTRTTR